MRSTVKKIHDKNFYIQNEFFQYWNAGWPNNEVKAGKKKEPHYNSTLYLDLFDPLFGLNKEQITLLQSPENIIAVNSGPGTGKSAMIPTMVAYWIKQKKFTPGEILILSFSGGELDSLREKLESMAGDQADEVTLTTFDKLCFNLLTRKKKGLPKLYSPMERDRFLSLIFPFLGKKELEKLSSDIETFEEQKKKTTDNDELVESYLASLEKINAYDLSLIHLQTHRHFTKDPGGLIHFKHKYKAILIDDFQNIENRQYDTLSIMLNTEFMDEEEGPEKRRTVVFADLYQATGSLPSRQNPLYYRFLNEYAQREIHFRKSYRMQKNITGAAKKIISKINKKAVYPLTAVSGKGEPVKIYKAASDHDEPVFIKDRLLELLESGGHHEGLKPGDVAVFYRDKQEADRIVDTLLSAEIPVSYFPAAPPALVPPFSSLLSLFNFMINQRDISSLADIMLEVLTDFKPGDAQSIFLAGNRKEESLSMLVNRLYQQHQLTDGQYNQIISLLQFLKELKACVKERGIAQALELIYSRYPGLIPTSPGLKLIHQYIFRRAFLYGRKIVEFIKSFYFYDYKDNYFFHSPLPDSESPAVNGDPNRPESASEHDEEELEEDLLPDREGVNIVPFHGVKSKEFKIIFITGMEESSFPFYSMNRKIDQEYRLFYLALTRARDEVYITYSANRGDKAARKSPLLKEIKAYSTEINLTPEEDTFKQTELF